jgi:purine-binding chemotaxis protein CheW
MCTKATRTSSEPLQLATFYVGDVCLALEIGQIQEILRGMSVTLVPHAPPEVTGVVNLRGEVTTVLDLRRLLGLPPAPITQNTRTLIVRSQGESMGLIVDRIGDICTVDSRSIVPPPPNVSSVDGRFLRGVSPTKSDIIFILDLEETLQQSMSAVNSPA